MIFNEIMKTLLSFSLKRDIVYLKHVHYLLYNLTRKPVVTGRKEILFFSIFSSQFLWYQKISVTTEDNIM